MTFSIVARDAVADGPPQFGVAVASKFLGVGAHVPAADAHAGALATQAAANLTYRPDGLALLRGGASAADAISQLTAKDDGRDHRQLGVVTARGAGATFTGAQCLDWAGGRTGDGYAIQGNILAGAHVVDEIEWAWRAGDPTAPLAQRLLAALTAGDAAGGDRRGRQSAALLVVSPGGGYGGGSDTVVDLRVDDHPQPVLELGRLLDLHNLYFGKSDPAALLPLTGDLAAEVTERLAALGHTDGDLDAALERWAGIENYEERLAPGRIDPLVLAQLRAATSATAAGSAAATTDPSLTGDS